MLNHIYKIIITSLKFFFTKITSTRYVLRHVVNVIYVGNYNWL